MSEEQSIDFSFSWLALRLLGRGLYSNPWSALSELVANGFDAGAKTVYLYINMKDKAHATVEVLDDGSGMDLEGIKLYATVGYDKRAAELEASSNSDLPSSQPVSTHYMGRKGIGKLAALYLSEQFFIRTKNQTSDTIWKLDSREANTFPDKKPSLQRETALPSSPVLEKWELFNTGTFLSLRDVNLQGFGDQGVKMLRSRLANQFLLGGGGEDDPERTIEIRVDAADAGDFAPAAKRIAFGNLAYVKTNFPHRSGVPAELSAEAREVILHAPGLPGEVYRHVQEIEPFKASPDTASAEWPGIKDRVDIASSMFDDFKFELTGWIGVHASIDKSVALKNDPLFDKNRYYNPAQIRLYVRGKLASDRLLGQLGLTGTYANYIEGELSFDFLDHDQFPDISTSNRQDFDETDDRVRLLRTLVRPLVRGLVSKRQELAKTIRKLEEDRKNKKIAVGKEQFAKTLNKDLAGISDLSEITRNEIQLIAVNKIKGDIEAKDDYRVFISHSSSDAAFTNFLYELLRSRGATEDEVFYTSKPDSTTQYEDPRALATVVRESIRSSNTLLFYLASHNFKSSEYCMFEGGAGWVTRSVREYLMLSISYTDIPKFLTQGESQMSLIGKDGAISLRPDLHNYVIECLLNPMIEHLNRGRDVAASEAIRPFDKVVFPSQVALDRNNQTRDEYFNPDIVDHWKSHVEPSIEDYLELRALADRRSKAASNTA